VSLAALILTPRLATAQSNPIVIENQQPGTDAWDIGDNLANDTAGQIKGYASAASVNKGQNITFYVSVNPAQTFTIDVYRIGYYQGLGGRLMQHIGPLNGTPQPACPMDAVTGMIECQWAAAYTLATQTSWTSGVYLCVLKNAQGFQNLMIFTVRDDSRVAAILYQSPVLTYQAYNDWPDDGKTGKSLYDFNSYGAILASTGYHSAAKVSFDRPYQDSGIDEGFRSDYGEVNFIKWMEGSGYDVTYATDIDTHVNNTTLLNYKGVLSMGHDEYWSKPMYDGFNAARDAGVNLAFFGADAVSWQIRMENSSTGVANRVEVCYRDVNLDPNPDLTLKTINWRDPVLNRPEQVLMGIQYNDNSSPPQNGQGFFPSYVVNNSTDWVYAGTGMTDGTALKGLIGYEADRYDNTFPSPNAVAGTYFLLSHSSWGSGQYQYANSSVYQAPSGAWVFASGTMNWNWALDVYGHGYNLVDPRAQQTTANILNRFVNSPGAGVSPTVTSVTPPTGSGSGGTSVTISGTNFVSGATVTFGTAAATGVVVVNGTTITATTPAQPAGPVTVTVTNPNTKSGTLASGFTYTAPAPTVSSVAPSSGPAVGGTSITITGANFVTGASVTIGGASATGVNVVNSTSITATTPAGSAGAASVVVTNSDTQSGTLTNGFTYLAPPPTVTNVAPGTGSTIGGTLITITGTNFVAGATVSVGGSAATGVTVVNATTITASTPAGAAGTVSVTVTNADGQGASLANAFTYNVTAPTISSVSPNTGLTTGGTPITITGTNFVTGATVTIGGGSASAVTVVSGTTITAATPAHAAGAANVVVTNPDTQVATLVNGFTYQLPAPTLSSVSPAIGLTTGGTGITLTGTNFVTGATVSVGGSAATGVTVVNATTITASTPTHAAGVVNIVVTNPDTQAATLASAFTYQLPAPTISAVAPGIGVTTGGTGITITGTNFVAGAAVTVGGSSASGVTVVNETTITASTPAHAAGPVDVVVTNSDGQAATLTNGFTYQLPAPTIGSISPNVGPAAGGTGITISGNNFVAGATVALGGSAATGVTVVNGTTITATTAARAGGVVNVVVTNLDAQTATLVSGFTYQLPAPTVTSVSPTIGLTTGGTGITIMGSNFAVGATVSVGGSAATGVTVVNATTITASTPAHAAGVVNIVVTNPDNQSATLASAFTYQLPAPTVSGVTPGVGVTTGGTGITITGSNFVSGATVTVGGNVASGVIVVSGTSITASTPAHAAGAVNIVVTNPDTQFGTLVNGFTYQLPAPTVSSVSPNNGVVTGGTAITVTGANFVTGASVTIGGNPAAGVVVVSSSTITATTPAGAIGTVAVSVTNPDNQTGTLANGFTYTAVGAPTLASVAPGSGLRGTAVGITLTGTNFAATGNTVAVSGTGVTVSNVAALNSTTITATFTISASAAISTRTVTVTTSSGTSNSQPFSVLGPVLSAVTPNTGARGTSVPVTLTGSGLATATGVTISGSNVTVSNFAVVDDGTVTATFTVGSGAGETARTVKVTTAGSGTSNGVTFTVDLPPAPTLTSVTPTTGVRGTAVPVTLLGSNFTATGTKVTVSGSGVTVSNLTVVDSGTLNATFTISATAGASTRNVTVTTPGGTTTAVTFTVQGPTLTSVSPNPVTHGTGVSLTLTGTNLAGATGITLGNLSDSCAVNNSTSTSVSATCTLVVGTTTVKVVTPIGTTGSISLTAN
jgi:hypothetical protein